MRNPRVRFNEIYVNTHTKLVCINQGGNGKHQCVTSDEFITRDKYTVGRHESLTYVAFVPLSEEE